jgi:hypothetical protein
MFGNQVGKLAGLSDIVEITAEKFPTALVNWLHRPLVMRAYDEPQRRGT